MGLLSFISMALVLPWVCASPAMDQLAFRRNNVAESLTSLSALHRRSMNRQSPTPQLEDVLRYATTPSHWKTSKPYLYGKRLGECVCRKQAEVCGINRMLICHACA